MEVLKQPLLILVTLLFACQQEKKENLDLSDEMEEIMATHRLPEKDQLYQKIAFGSCSDQRKPQSYWDTIAMTQPDLWIWLGDNIYADTDQEDSMRAMYKSILFNQHYQEFIKQVPVTGIWDDHDYGLNDGGKEWEFRKTSQELFFDFMNDSLHRDSPGIYRSYALGEGERSLLLLLLDTRYFRDDPAEGGDILGDAQWEWLEKSLEESKAPLVFLASGIQVLAEDHPYETWAQFPKEREKLLNLACEHADKQFVILSGDRHLSEIAEMSLDSCDKKIIDVTASGLTHAFRNFQGEENRHRLGEVYPGKNFGTAELNWEASTLRLNIHSIDGEIQLSHLVVF